MVLGVEETDCGFTPVGIDGLVDKADIDKGIATYLPDEIEYMVLDFPFKDSEYPDLIGKVFQVVIVEDKPEYLPYLSKRESDSLKRDAIYVRRGTSTEIAAYEDIQTIINRRLVTGYSSSAEMDLEQHIAQLRVLYSNIQRYKRSGGLASLMDAPMVKMFYGQEVPNENYPKEDFEQFIARMITNKKRRIEQSLDLG